MDLFAMNSITVRDIVDLALFTNKLCQGLEIRVQSWDDHKNLIIVMMIYNPKNDALEFTNISNNHDTKIIPLSSIVWFSPVATIDHRISEDVIGFDIATRIEVFPMWFECQSTANNFCHWIKTNTILNSGQY